MERSLSGGKPIPDNSESWLIPGEAPNDRNDMILTVTTYRIDGAGGEPRIDARFTDDEEKRLESLRTSLSSLQDNVENIEGKNAR